MLNAVLHPAAALQAAAEAHAQKRQSSLLQEIIALMLVAEGAPCS